MLVVDAANVVGSVPDGWWRDRAGANLRLRDALIEVSRTGLEDRAPLALRHGPIEVVLIVEGAASGIAAIPEVQVVTAPGNGDDTIVDVVAQRGANRYCAVATADRALSDRVKALGAIVIGPRSVRRT